MVTMQNLPKTKSAKYDYGDIICWDLVAQTVIRGHPPMRLHNFHLVTWLNISLHLVTWAGDWVAFFNNFENWSWSKVVRWLRAFSFETSRLSFNDQKLCLTNVDQTRATLTNFVSHFDQNCVVCEASSCDLLKSCFFRVRVSRSCRIQDLLRLERV